ncbi:MAG: ATP-binding protein, partial [Bacteroidetes bacterium]|nr:ATP-binding protein [Bacteroidota bacterium]
MKSPFKFLDSFLKEDKAIFFGRERETEELYQKIFESKILLVYGISGTGKTSLINCGLANKFNDSDWLPVSVRRGGDINESLLKAIGKHLVTEVGSGKSAVGSDASANQLPATDYRLPTDEPDRPKNAIPPHPVKPLRKLLKNLYLDHFKPIYLIFDQFEELFIFGTEAEKDEFVQTIKKIVESDLQVKFLFVIREEYLAGVTEFERHIPEILENRIRIEKMRRTNAVQCIEGPCRVAGIAVEEGFSDALLDKLSPGSAEVELTYLQVFLDKIYRTADPQGHLTKGTALRIGESAEYGDLAGRTASESLKTVIPSEAGGSFASPRMTFSDSLLSQTG